MELHTGREAALTDIRKGARWGSRMIGPFASVRDTFDCGVAVENKLEDPDSWKHHVGDL